MKGWCDFEKPISGYGWARMTELLGGLSALEQAALVASLDPSVVKGGPSNARDQFLALWSAEVEHISSDPAPAGCFVYVIGAMNPDSQEPDAIKIGIAQNTSKRVRDLQCSHYQELSILTDLGVASTEEARWIESAAHAEMANWHLRGEWFLPEVETAVQTISSLWADQCHKRDDGPAPRWGRVISPDDAHRLAEMSIMEVMGGLLCAKCNGSGLGVKGGQCVQCRGAGSERISDAERSEYFGVTKYVWWRWWRPRYAYLCRSLAILADGVVEKYEVAAARLRAEKNQRL